MTRTLLALSLLIALAACATIDGLGRDTQALGKTLSDAAN
jgi:predicted small secreted protein